jgi:hypothetical protein
MWKRKMARVSQLPLRLLPRARNLLFRLSPSELLTGRIKGKFEDISLVLQSTTKQKNDSSEPCGFRPLTEDEKKEFEKSLNEDGKRMLREISGKLLTDVEIKQKRKKNNQAGQRR